MSTQELLLRQAGVENISPELWRRVLYNFASYVIGIGPGFGKHIGDRIRVTELLVCLQSFEAKAVCDIVVMEDMLNVAEDALHGGCCAYLIDMCTALPFILLGLAQEEQGGEKHSIPSLFAMAPFAPSQCLDITYHHAAPIGAHLRILGISLTHAGSSLTVLGEIWNIDEDRLVASAVHTKVMPKKPPPAANIKL